MTASRSPETRDVEDAILLVVSGGLSDFIQNTLASIERCGKTQSTICIALPRNAIDEVTRAVALRWPNIEYLVLEELSQTDYSWIRKHHDVGTKEFARFTVAKWTTIRHLLKRGYKRVTYTDIDVAWIRDPMPLIRAALESYDMAMQTEGQDKFPTLYCTGFMSFRNSKVANQLLQFVENNHLETIKTLPNAFDQAIFNSVISNSKGIVNRICTLSEQLFATGPMARAMVSDDEQLDRILRHRIKPMIFHANCTIGLENKRRLLQRTGNWLIGESAPLIHSL